MNAAAREGGGRGGLAGVSTEVRDRIKRDVCVDRLTCEFDVWYCDGSGSRRDLWLSSRSGFRESGRRSVNKRLVKNVRSRGTKGLLLVEAAPC